jgi:hypothetical protein
MDLATITAADFKALFRRDFPYLPTYDAATRYNAGREAYIPSTDLFYTCLVNGTVGVTPGYDATKWLLTDDSADNYVADADITEAFGEAGLVFNQALFTGDENIKRAYLFLAAHFLSIDLRNGLGGIGGVVGMPVTQRSVGSTSESYQVPQAYIDDPILAQYTSTGYGMKYLGMVMPRIVGNVAAVFGGTNA